MVVAGRISQGLEEMGESRAQERAEVFRRWITIEEDVKRSNKRHTVQRSHFHMQETSHVV
jgi:hypothetical protein